MAEADGAKRTEADRGVRGWRVGRRGAESGVGGSEVMGEIGEEGEEAAGGIERVGAG